VGRETKGESVGGRRPGAPAPAAPLPRHPPPAPAGRVLRQLGQRRASIAPTAGPASLGGRRMRPRERAPRSPHPPLPSGDGLRRLTSYTVLACNPSRPKGGTGGAASPTTSCGAPRSRPSSRGADSDR
jgi:hypothetical protein